MSFMLAVMSEVAPVYAASVTQPILVATPSGGSTFTYTVSGCSVSPTSGTSGSSSSPFTATASCVLTVTMPSAAGSTRYVFALSASSTTVTTCSSGTCSQFGPADYYQVSESFSYSVTRGGAGAPTLTCYQSGTQGSCATLTTTSTAYWLDYNTAWSITNPLSGSSTSEQWAANTDTSGTSSAGGSVNPVYYDQYSFTLSYSVSYGGSGYSAPTLASTQFGKAYAPDLTGTPTAYWLDSGQPWNVTDPLGPSSSNERWDTSQTVAGTVAGAVTSAYVYYHQYSLILSYRVGGGGSPTAPTLTSAQFGSAYTPTLTESATACWLDVGQSWSVTNPLSSSRSTERWVTDAPSGVATGNQTRLFLYLHQYLVLVTPNVSSAGAVLPISGWYHNDASLNLSANAHGGWDFNGWLGKGLSSYTGPDRVTTLSVTGSISETGVFYAGLTITAPKGGDVSYEFGSTSGTVQSDSTKTIYLPPSTNITLSAQPSFFSLDRWKVSTANGTMSSTAATISLVVTSPSTVEVAYAYNVFTIALVAVAAGVALMAAVFSRRLARLLRRNRHV